MNVVSSTPGLSGSILCPKSCARESSQTRKSRSAGWGALCGRRKDRHVSNLLLIALRTRPIHHLPPLMGIVACSESGSDSDSPPLSQDGFMDFEASAGEVPVIGIFMHGGGYCHMSAHESAPTSQIPARLIKVCSISDLSTFPPHFLHRMEHSRRSTPLSTDFSNTHPSLPPSKTQLRYTRI